MKTKLKKAVFLDRDGVLNEERNYAYKIEDFKFIKGVFKALKRLQDMGYLLIVVTNQSGINRGYYTKDDFFKITEYMNNRFKKKGIHIDKVYFCPHTPEENCNCRKPKPQMILNAQSEFDIDLKNSWIVGDKISDMIAGLNAGIPNRILVKSGHKIDDVKGAVYMCDNLLSASYIISDEHE